MDAQRRLKPRAPRHGSGRRGGGRAEDGYTLIELLVAMVLMAVVVGGPLTFIVVASNRSDAATSRSVAERSAESMLERLTREIRQAQRIVDQTGANTTPVSVTYGGGTSSITFFLPNAGSSTAGTEVIWTCTAGASCTRAACTLGSVAACGTPGANPANWSTVTELQNIVSATFTPTASDGSTPTSGSSTPPVFLAIQIQAQDTSQLDPSHAHAVRGVLNPITVQDGVGLRSYT